MGGSGVTLPLSGKKPLLQMPGAKRDSRLQRGEFS